MSVDIIQDCEWFLHILQWGHLQSVPVSIFADIEPPRVLFYSDACDTALVVLNMATKQYILVEFDNDEKEAILRIKAKTAARRLRRMRNRRSGTRDNADIMPDNHDDVSINVREFFAVVLAMAVRGGVGQTPWVASTGPPCCDRWRCRKRRYQNALSLAVRRWVA